MYVRHITKVTEKEEEEEEGGKKVGVWVGWGWGVWGYCDKPQCDN